MRGIINRRSREIFVVCAGDWTFLKLHKTHSYGIVQIIPSTAGIAGCNFMANFIAT